MLAKIISAGRTDVGKKRDHNEDQYLIADLNKSMLVQSTSLNVEAQSRLYGMSHGKLLMVADGLGGHQGGSRASRMAIDLLINQLLNSMHWFSGSESDELEREAGFVQDLKQLMKHAHTAIEKEANAEAGKKGMGTTLTVAYVIWPWMYVLHAGDSRCYLLREGELRQLTRDHTVSNQLIEKGGMTVEEANNSRWSNMLYNALGAGAAEVVPEVHKVELRTGDTILLCTDGLYRHVGNNEIRDLLETELEPSDSCRSLIDLANFRGGLDNITAVVARLGTPEDNSHPKTKVATEITLERLLRDTTGFQPLVPPGGDDLADQVTPPDKPFKIPDTAEFGPKQSILSQK